MAQRITRLTTDQKIGGSNPLGIEIFFNFLTVVLGILIFMLTIFKLVHILKIEGNFKFH